MIKNFVRDIFSKHYSQRPLVWQRTLCTPSARYIATQAMRSTKPFRVLRARALPTAQDPTYNHAIEHDVILKYVPRHARILQQRAREADILLHDEAMLLTQLHHPHIRQCEQWLGKQHIQVLTHIPGIDLSHLLHGVRMQLVQPIPWELAEAIYTQLIDILTYLHARHIAHGDMRPRNLLLTQPAHITLIDFTYGVWPNKQLIAEYDETEDATHANQPQPDPYLAPEIRTGRQKQASPATDMYQTGILIKEVLAAVTPESKTSAGFLALTQHAQTMCSTDPNQRKRD